LRWHEWRERTDDGELRLVRAVHHGGHWRVESRLKSEFGFQRLDPISSEDLSTLLEIIQNKYRRGRAPHEHIAQLKTLVEEAEAREAAED
jgi:hypothetical protein